ncbi:MAG: hypothetical protein JJU13_13640 [Balneolaceae bacterium]|nr:hypothetical protein [Balneolaceae bacterium]
MKKLLWLLPIIGALLLLGQSCSTKSTPVYQLNTSVEPSEAGSVNQSATEAEEGETITITANANEHWVFDRWSGDHSGTDNPATIMLDADKSVTALFEKRDYPLTIHIEGEGSVDERVVQAKTTDYPHGTVVELTPIPSDGWELISWSGDVSSTEEVITVTIDGETNITATFERKAYPMTITVEVDNITTGSVTAQAEIEQDDLNEISERGACAVVADHSSAEPICSVASEAGFGPYSVLISGLEADTRYEVYSFAISFERKTVSESEIIETAIRIEDSSDIEGSIQLPAGSSVNTETLQVHSPYSGTGVADGRFAINTPGDFSIQYVTNDEESVILMGYNYPGAPDHNINPESTALALIMNMPLMADLSDDAKMDVINEVRNSSGFRGLINQIEESSGNNRDLFDENNQALLAALENVLSEITPQENTSTIRSKNVQYASGNNPPVNIFQSGRELVFNTTKTHSSVIGIYEDDSRLEKIEVLGNTYVAESLSEIISGTANPGSDFTDYPYQLPNDGEYDVIIRTGRPGSGDGSDEHTEAFVLNSRYFVTQSLSSLFPYINTLGCIPAVYASTANLVPFLLGLGSMNDPRQVLVEVTKEM